MFEQRLNNAGKYCDITLADFGKQIYFSDEAHFNLDGYVYKQNCGLRTIRTHTLKSRRTQNESLFGADFVPEA